MEQFLAHWRSDLIAIGMLVGAILVGLIVYWVVFALLKRFAAKPGRIVDASILKHGRRFARWMFPFLALLIVTPETPFPTAAQTPLEHIFGLLIIAAIAWGAILLTDVLEDVIVARHRVDVRDNLAARRVNTQVQVLRRIFTVIVMVVALALMLLTIPQVRSIGTSVLASAGLAGLVLGMAAKSTLGNLIAGIQIALTQPMRLEDVVIVNGEWGWIEEIRTTYVVVRVWDLTRLVVPLTYFIENPFQNWTRTTANLLAYVYVYADYTVPVEEVRAELRRVLESTDKWLGQVCVLQASDSSEHTVQLRALMDAPDSGTAWDLRCYVREKLIQFLQEKYPQCLPKARAELNSVPQPARVA